MWGAWWPGWTEAHVVWIAFNRSKYFLVGRETIAGHSVLGGHLFLECQWQQAAQIFVIEIERGVFGDVRWENGAIGTVQVVAFGRCPMGQVRVAVVFVNDSEFLDVLQARPNGNTILE